MSAAPPKVTRASPRLARKSSIDLPHDRLASERPRQLVPPLEAIWKRRRHETAESGKRR
jgi:hypothetical protein